MRTNILLCLLTLAAVPAAATWAGEHVAIRVAGNRFLRASEEGGVWAERGFPFAEETFELVPCGDGQIALRAYTGRFLIASDNSRVLRAVSLASEPGRWETFTVVPADGNRVALKAYPSGGFVRFVPLASAPGAVSSDKPSEAETAEIDRLRPIPEGLRSMISTVVRTVALEELEDREYDKTRTRKKERLVELPAPTLRNLRRRKERRIWSVTEEYRIRARLDDSPAIELKHMALLDRYPHAGDGRLMFLLEATLPVQGQVRYRIPEVLSATTNFRTTIHLVAIGQLGAAPSAGPSPFGAPELVALRVQISRLDISNDLLNLGRALIEDLINHELRDNEDRIREKANRSIRKALEKHPVRLPLLRYLGLPLR